MADIKHLCDFAENWRSITDDPFILSILEKGAILPLPHDPSPAEAEVRQSAVHQILKKDANYHSELRKIPMKYKLSEYTTSRQQILRANEFILNQLVGTRTVVQLTPEQVQQEPSCYLGHGLLHSSPFSHRPLRIQFDMLQYAIDTKSAQDQAGKLVSVQQLFVATPANLLDIVKRGDLFLRISLKLRRFLIPLMKEHQHCADFIWMQSIYRYTSLPPDLPYSKTVFARFINAAVIFLQKNGLRVALCDNHDLILMSQSPSKLKRALDDTLGALELLGLPFEPVLFRPSSMITTDTYGMLDSFHTVPALLL